jgi:hypothetical protein
MRILTSCFQCTNEATDPLAVAADWIDLGEVTEAGAAAGECSKGHQLRVIIQDEQYVLLFDSACLALLDGYYREAIGSFAASLERLYEFAIRVLCRHRGLETEAIDTAWKLVAKQSERQYGAFVFLFATHTGRAPDQWKHEELRNEVVHRGKLPTRNDAMTFGAACYDRILDITDELQRSAADPLEKESAIQMGARAASLPRGTSTTTIGPGTSPVTRGRIHPTRPSFEEALAAIGRFTHWIHPADRLTVARLAETFGLTAHQFLQALGNEGMREAINAARRAAKGESLEVQGAKGS